MPKYGGRTLTTTANLANLLPTGTVLAFETLLPSFSKNGTCEVANKYMTLTIIIFCSLACFITSFTDSFIGVDDKIYFGVATPHGLYVINDGDHGKEDDELERFKLRFIDFVHAIVSLTVFLVFALSDTNVQNCFFPNAGANSSELIRNLPLGIMFLGSFVFTVFPTNRRGIGYADSTRR